jgi:hypothetical protein
MAHTAWGPTEIARFMRWQLSLFKEGKIKRQHVGGFSYRLPTLSKQRYDSQSQSELNPISHDGMNQYLDDSVGTGQCLRLNFKTP